MAKFRTKPFEIEAEQYLGTDADLERWLVMLAFAEEGEFKPEIRGTMVETEDGTTMFPIEVYDHLHDTWVKVANGQWIIKGGKGEYYPCDPDVFEAKYEPVSDERPNHYDHIHVALGEDHISDGTAVEEDEV